MRDEGVPYGDLEVVGFADTLPQNVLPRLVPPVFRRLNTPDQFVLPPFTLRESDVVGFIPSTEHDFEQAIARGQASRIAPIPAKAGHQLWIDLDRLTHYAPAKEVLLSLRDISQRYVQMAMNAIKGGHFEEASRLAQVAISANERGFDALLVKAIVQRQRGHEEQVNVLRKICRVVAPSVDIKAWVDLYLPIEQAVTQALRDGGELLSRAHDRPELDLALQDLGAAADRLQGFVDHVDVAKQANYIERSRSALERLRQDLQRLYSKRYDEQIVILIQLADIGCPTQSYADISLYRLWCVRSLRTLLTNTVDQNPPPDDEEWAVANTAASYLARLGTHEMRADNQTTEARVIEIAYDALKDTVGRCAQYAIGPRFFWRDLFGSYALMPGADLTRLRRMISPASKILRETLESIIADRRDVQPIEALRTLGFVA